jgi:hypothetical protein
LPEPLRARAPVLVGAEPALERRERAPVQALLVLPVQRQVQQRRAQRRLVVQRWLCLEPLEPPVVQPQGRWLAWLVVPHPLMRAEGLVHLLG